MKKQIRFTTRAQILRKIDEYKSRQVQLMAEAEQREDSARKNLEASLKCRSDEAFEFTSQAQHDKDTAAKRRHSAYRIDTITLPKLKRALAAMDTSCMEFARGAAVVLE